MLAHCPAGQQQQQHMLQHLLPNPEDSAAVLLEKQLQLLVCLQVYEAWESRATDHQHQLADAPLLDSHDGGGPEEMQEASPPSCSLQQQQLKQQHAPPLPPPPPLHLRQLLGTESTEDQQAAAGMQQQQQQQDHGAGSARQPSTLQQAGGITMPTPAPALAAAAQQQHPTSNKELLARLLMPGQGGQQPAGADGAPAAAAAAGMQARMQQPHKAGQGRQRRLQQGRRSLLGAGAPAGHQPPHQDCEDSPGPLQQQMLLAVRAQHYLMDAQSQAPGAGAAAATAAAPASLQWPAPPAQQQLFSPRTATHAPLQAAGSSGGSGMHGSTGQAGTGGHADPEAMPAQRPAQHQQQQQAVALQPEQPEEIEVTPAQPRAAAGAAHQQQPPQQWGSGDAAATRAATSAAAAAALGLHPAGMHSEAPRPTVAATPDAALDPQAAVALAPATAADTPVTAHTELLAAAGSRRAAAAAAAGLAAALFHTPAAPGHTGNPRGMSVEPTTAAMALQAVQGVPQAVSGVGSMPGSSELGATPPSTAQHVSASAGHTLAEGSTGAAAAECAQGGLPPLGVLLPYVSAASGPEPGAAAAAAAAAAGVSAGPGCVPGSSPLLDETQPPSQQQQQQQQQLDQPEPARLQAAAVLAGPPSHVPATPASEACSGGGASSSKQQNLHNGLLQAAHPCAAAGSPAHEAQQHQAHKRQRLSALNPSCRPSPQPLAASPGAEPATAAQVVVEGCTAGAGSSKDGCRSFVLDKLQHRVRELMLGQPVQHILCCRGYAAVLLQEAAAGSHTHRVLLLRTSRQQQQQQQQCSARVVVTATRLSVLVGPSQHTAAATTPAARAAASQQQHSKAQQDLLRAGLLLLPLPPIAPEAAAGPGQQQGPLLVVASGLQLQGADGGAGSTGLAPAEAGATPAGQRSTNNQIPGQAALPAGTAAASSGKRKLRKAAADTAQGIGSDVSPQAGARGCSQHTVNIYQLNCSAAGAATGGQDRAGAVLVQALPTAFAVRCLAACEQEGLLAAAGGGGSACVWRLTQQRQAGGAAHAGADGPAAAAAAAAGGLSKQPVADASAAIVLPAATYRGIPFPEISEVCILVQGTSGDGVSEHSGQHTQMQPMRAAANASAVPGLFEARRVLLVGCCSQGPVAVWDVGLRQQILAVHSPGLRLSGLLPAGPGAAAVAATAAAAMRAHQAVAGRSAAAAASGVHQHQQGSTGEQQPVACLAVVSSLDSSGSGAATGPGQQQLRAVVLHGDGDTQMGQPLVCAGAGGVSTAVLSGTTAAAVACCGMLQVWDLLSGARHMSMRPRCSRAGTAGTVALLPLDAAMGAVGGGEAGVHPASEGAGDILLLAGSSTGALSVAML